MGDMVADDSAYFRVCVFGVGVLELALAGGRLLHEMRTRAVLTEED